MSDFLRMAMDIATAPPVNREALAEQCAKSATAEMEPLTKTWPEIKCQFGLPPIPSRTEHWTGMSNQYHEIDDGFEDALRSRPNEVYGYYAGWDFNGRVWFDGEKFNCEVWHYREIQEVISALTLRDLMEAVSDKWGDE